MERLVNWYASYCDGDWEHSYGVTIETLDNPGWTVKIDLADTELASLHLEYSRQDRSATDWVGYKVVAGKFHGAGGVGNLEEIIEIFLKIAEEPANSVS
jgi:hypothetical protein